MVIFHSYVSLPEGNEILHSLGDSYPNRIPNGGSEHKTWFWNGESPGEKGQLYMCFILLYLDLESGLFPSPYVIWNTSIVWSQNQKCVNPFLLGCDRDPLSEQEILIQTHNSS